MNLAPSASIPSLVESSGRHAWYTGLVRWFVEARSHRVLCLVGGIWLLNAFDLILTVLAHQQGVLQEDNPIARYMFGLGIPSVILFKIGLVSIGSYPLLRFRTARITEMGSLVILLAYAYLAVHWSECYELYTLASVADVQLAELTSISPTGD